LTPVRLSPDIPDLITARDRAEINAWKLNNQPAAEIRPKKRKKEPIVEREFFNKYLKNQLN
jgi:hypothetical protein